MAETVKAGVWTTLFLRRFLIRSSQVFGWLRFSREWDRALGGVGGGEGTVSGVGRVRGEIACRRIMVFGFAGALVRSGRCFSV